MAACSGGGGDTGAGTTAASAAVQASATAAPSGPVAHRPRRGDGSAAAMSRDGRHIYVAGEDHEVVFVAPT